MEEEEEGRASIIIIIIIIKPFTNRLNLLPPQN